MGKITIDTIPEEIEILKPYAPYLKWSPGAYGTDRWHNSIRQSHDRQPTWPVESMILGLERVVELAEKGKVLYDAYTVEEIAEDSSRGDVKFWYMPAYQESSDKPFILSYAGGGYKSVCSYVESFATAARMNELGYNVFVPTYRVDMPELMPRPLEDVAACLRMILNNKELFNIHDERYVMNGFSAGGNLTCLWGLKEKGYGKYNLPKPHALFPIYAVTTWDNFGKEESVDLFEVMFGTDHTSDLIEGYDVIKNMTHDYPPCYIVHAKNDPVVPYENSVLLKDKLESFKIAADLELSETGAHGFGDGRGTGAEHWPDRAIAFLESLL